MAIDIIARALALKAQGSSSGMLLGLLTDGSELKTARDDGSPLVNGDNMKPDPNIPDGDFPITVHDPISGETIELEKTDYMEYYDGSWNKFHQSETETGTLDVTTPDEESVIQKGTTQAQINTENRIQILGIKEKMPEQFPYAEIYVNGEKNIVIENPGNVTIKCRIILENIGVKVDNIQHATVWMETSDGVSYELGECDYSGEWEEIVWPVDPGLKNPVKFIIKMSYTVPVYETHSTETKDYNSSDFGIFATVIVRSEYPFKCGSYSELTSGAGVLADSIKLSAYDGSSFEIEHTFDIEYGKPALAYSTAIFGNLTGIFASADGFVYDNYMPSFEVDDTSLPGVSIYHLKNDCKLDGFKIRFEKSN